MRKPGKYLGEGISPVFLGSVHNLYINMGCILIPELMKQDYFLCELYLQAECC